MYRDMSMSERLDRIGELLAKGIYLHMKKEEEANKVKKENKTTQPIVKLIAGVREKNQ